MRVLISGGVVLLSLSPELKAARDTLPGRGTEAQGVRARQHVGQAGQPC